MGRGMYAHSAGMGYAGGEAIIQAVFGVLFFVILVSLAVILVRFALRGGRRGMWMRHMMMQHGSSMETLKQRYAKGEIDKKEFDEKRKDLIE